MTMKSGAASVLGIAMLLGLSYAWAQDTPKPTKPAPAPTAKSETTKKASKGRLPPHFAKVGVSDVQRDKIYSIQGKYKPEIDKLEEQLKALRAQEMTEVEGVLTTEQKTRVSELRAEAQKKRDEKKKTAPAESDDDEDKPAETAK
jgi:hypothetical protein